MAYAVERGISLASDNPQVSGSEVRFEVASVTGYPKNFTIGITEIEIGAKDKFTWATQEVLVEAKSYQAKQNKCRFIRTTQHIRRARVA